MGEGRGEEDLPRDAWIVKSPQKSMAVEDYGGVIHQFVTTGTWCMYLGMGRFTRTTPANLWSIPTMSSLPYSVNFSFSHPPPGHQVYLSIKLNCQLCSISSTARKTHFHQSYRFDKKKKKEKEERLTFISTSSLFIFSLPHFEDFFNWLLNFSRFYGNGYVNFVFFSPAMYPSCVLR